MTQYQALILLIRNYNQAQNTLNTVKAIDAAGNVSKESTALTVKTTVEAPDTEAPTQPKGLHSMGTTASSVDLV